VLSYAETFIGRKSIFCNFLVICRVKAKIQLSSKSLLQSCSRWYSRRLPFHPSKGWGEAGLEAPAISDARKYDGFPEHESQGKSNGSSRVSFFSLPKFSATRFKTLHGYD
jgi:hypothetical protein